MRSNNYSSINPENGNVTWDGPLSIEKGNHSHMPPRTEAYLDDDEKGHVNASSLGGKNTVANVVPQNREVNHGAYQDVEAGERTALQNGARIDSIKTAIVNGRPGDRPEAFMVSDHVTYADGHTESIHHSFSNFSNAEQQAWSTQALDLPGIYDAPNPGNPQDVIGSAEYAELMETTDAQLPGLDAVYEPADFSGIPSAAPASDTIAETSEADLDVDDSISNDHCDADSSPASEEV